MASLSEAQSWEPLCAELSAADLQQITGGGISIAAKVNVPSISKLNLIRDCTCVQGIQLGVLTNPLVLPAINVASVRSGLPR